MENSANTIVESRKQFMISPTAPEISFFRTAYFLKPSLSSNSKGISQLSLPALRPLNWPFTVIFNGWMNPTGNWKEWVDKMASLHSITWKKAGIYEAILNSTYRFYKNDELVLGFAEKWCPETNSFIFPWGEATVTLEDMMIAGYPVSGSPVFQPLETQELKAIEEALILERLKLNKSSAKKPLHYDWLKVFKDSSSEIEHEAFLSMWLSRFVLPTNRNVISRYVFPIAVQLARGTKFAIAPAVLASIYRDLCLIKEKIVSLNDKRVVVTTSAPFQLFLVWVWERFVKLSPEPKLIKNGEPRLAMWDNLRCNIKDVRLVLDSCGESFCWRPYTKTLENWDVSKFYREKEMWVLADSDLDEDLLSFILCLRVSNLVGLERDCIEQYLPHRVARQFGFDQDVPGCVTRSKTSPGDAWSCFITPVTGVKSYVPSCFFEAHVTKRYLDWWNSLGLVDKQNTSQATDKHETISEIVAKACKEKKKGKKKGTGSLNRTKGADCGSISSSTSLKGSKSTQFLLARVDHVKQSRPLASSGSKKDNKYVEAGNCTEEDNLTIAEILKQNKKYVSGKAASYIAPKTTSDEDNGENADTGNFPGQSSVAGNENSRNMEQGEAILEENALVKEKQDVESVNKSVPAGSLTGNEINSVNGTNKRRDGSVEAAFLAARDTIERVEKLFAARKALLESKRLRI